MEKVQATFCPLADKPPLNKERHTLYKTGKKKKEPIRSSEHKQFTETVGQNLHTRYRKPTQTPFGQC